MFIQERTFYHLALQEILWASQAFSVDVPSWTCAYKFLIRYIFYFWFFLLGTHNLLLSLVSACCLIGPLEKQNASQLFFSSVTPRYLEYAGSQQCSERDKTMSVLLAAPIFFKSVNVECMFQSFFPSLGRNWLLGVFS